MLRNIYVDNVAFGCTTPEEVPGQCQEAMEMFRTVSMPLREFCSKEVIEQLPVDKRAPNLHEAKLLGLTWKTSEDEFIIRFPGPPQTFAAGTICLSKRSDGDRFTDTLKDETSVQSVMGLEFHLG